MTTLPDVKPHHAAHEQGQTELLGGERFSGDIISSLPGIFYLFDERGKMLRWNENLERVTAYTGAEIATMSSLEFFSVAQQATMADVIGRALVEGNASVDAELVAKDGRATPYLFSAKCVVSKGQRYLVGTGTDVSERKETEAALAESEQKFRQLAERINAVFWVSDLGKNEMVYISPAYETVWGRTRSSLYKTPYSFIDAIHADDRARVVAAFALQAEGKYDETYRVVQPDGAVRWVRDRAFPIHDERGVPYRVVGFAEDITELKGANEALAALNRDLERRVAERTAELASANEQLLHDAFHDALTGLPNRALFMDRLGQALAREQRNPEDAFAVLFLDFDRFKEVNDTLGHAAGDALLCDVAARLEACLRSTDTVARLGGDEFTLLALEVPSLEDVARLVERLQAAFASPFHLEDQTLSLSASVGVVLSRALSGVGYAHADEVLRDADFAMYRAKAQGEGEHVIFDSGMRERALARTTLESDLRLALERGELRVHYQPIMTTRAGLGDDEPNNTNATVLAGFEALVRWQHPERGLVTPAEFIPVAEETGLITEIDRFVLCEASRQMAAWRARLGETLELSVNLSSAAFARADLVTYVADVLRDTGLAAARLKLEITERLLMDDAPVVSRALNGLRELGVQLHIDDFGTGYSSLSYLQRFSAHTLKIDRSFVDKMVQSSKSAELVRTIVAMAHALGMRVVAEGVETAAQLAQLEALGCEYVQGYLFSRPLGADAALAFAEAHAAPLTLA